MRANAHPFQSQKSSTISGLPVRRRRLASFAPRVVPIYWDARFRSHPLDITVFDEFLRALFQSSWMTELEARGVAPARLLPSFVPHSAAATKLTRRALEATVMDWAHRGLVTPGPGTQDEDLFYLVLARFKAEPGGGSGSQCVAISLLDVGPELLEIHSAAISRALATAFTDRAGERIALSRTSTTRRGLPTRR